MTEKDKKIHLQFQEYGMNAKQWMRKCELLLPEIARRKIWLKKGFNSIYEYTAKLAGMNRKKVDDVLWILRKVEDKPKLMKVVEEKGLNRIRPIISAIDDQNEEFWAEKAMKMPQRTLRVYKNNFLINQKNENFENSSLSHRDETFAGFSELPKTEQIVLNLSPKNIQKLKKLKNEKSWDEVISELLQMREKQLESERPSGDEHEEVGAVDGCVARQADTANECAAKQAGTAISTKSKQVTHYISTKIRNFIKKRSNCVCEFPSCTKKAKHFHHTMPFALKREHDPRKIRYLCREHHNLAHLGLIENEEMSPDRWGMREKPDPIDFKNVIHDRVAEHSLA